MLEKIRRLQNNPESIVVKNLAQSKTAFRNGQNMMDFSRTRTYVVEISNIGQISRARRTN